MCSRRLRVTSMFSSTSPSSQSYQVATEWGEPSGSERRDDGGIRLAQERVDLRRDGWRRHRRSLRVRVLPFQRPHVAHGEHRQRDGDADRGGAPERRAHADRVGDRPGERVADRDEGRSSRARRRSRRARACPPGSPAASSCARAGRRPRSRRLPGTRSRRSRAAPSGKPSATSGAGTSRIPSVAATSIRRGRKRRPRRPPATRPAACAVRIAPHAFAPAELLVGDRPGRAR